jgi:hypothetical protein
MGQMTVGPGDLLCFFSGLRCVVLCLERDDVAQTFQALDQIAPKLLGLELVKIVRAQVGVADLCSVSIEVAQSRLSLRKQPPSFPVVTFLDVIRDFVRDVDGGLGRV